ncbi:hypothetical protein PEX1_035980 [Penicillium expansum]|uniref:Uncharacterized protein n=1 Tax=Penicillium expansum TaxID=27334 RepID=A0A0A2KK14_PENEN|nr:hypothetical protein PEX2_063030 [Penicillium expansum]KGO45439.1 hypothetical protein PEXP_060670 [Penicillium expansum]KGO50633.1 hypothetical protein PEX2_063030 [Penicillium expansum]KGO67241.1 hypothetical protein PEX1_035980 [Penicillium expansum]
MFAHKDKKLATQDLDTPEGGPCETFRFAALDLARNYLHLWRHHQTGGFRVQNSRPKDTSRPLQFSITQYPRTPCSCYLIEFRESRGRAMQLCSLQ